MGKIHVDNAEIAVISINTEDYISLTDMVVHMHIEILRLNLLHGYHHNLNYIWLKNFRD